MKSRIYSEDKSANDKSTRDCIISRICCSRFNYYINFMENES